MFNFKKSSLLNPKAILSVVILSFLFFSCESAPVKKTNLKALLNGTFVYSGPVEGSAPMTVTYRFNSGNRTFVYSEAGGIKNRNYSGKYLIMGDKVVLTNSSRETSTHIISSTSNGFKMNCTVNDNPISFGLQPLAGSSLEFFKQ